MTDTKAEKATATAAAAATAAAEAEEVDSSIVGKIRRSGLYFVRDHSTGLDYVGISPQNDPKASDASKLRSSVMPLDVTPPKTGMQIKPESGDSFSVADGFGPDATVEDWAKVLTPSGAPLFA